LFRRLVSTAKNPPRIPQESPKNPSVSIAGILGIQEASHNNNNNNNNNSSSSSNSNDSNKKMLERRIEKIKPSQESVEKRI